MHQQQQTEYQISWQESEREGRQLMQCITNIIIIIIIERLWET